MNDGLLRRYRVGRPKSAKLNLKFKTTRFSKKTQNDLTLVRDTEE
jgi:hypothetical protein